MLINASLPDGDDHVDGRAPSPPADASTLSPEIAEWFRPLQDCVDLDMSGFDAIYRLHVELHAVRLFCDMEQMYTAVKHIAAELSVCPEDVEEPGAVLQRPPGADWLLWAYWGDEEGDPPILTTTAPSVPIRELIDIAVTDLRRMEEALATDAALPPLCRAVQMSPEGEPTRRAWRELMDHIHKHYEGIYVNFNAALRIGSKAPAGDTHKASVASGSASVSESEKRSGASLNERRFGQLNALLDSAKQTGDAEALLAAFPRKLGHITEQQYSAFRVAVKAATDEADLFIDMRAMDRARTDAKKRIDGQTALMKKVDIAFKAGKATIIVSNRQLADLRAEAVGRLRGTNAQPVLFQRQRELVRYRVDALGQPYLEPLNEISIRGRLTDVADFLVESGKGGYVATIPPRALCEDILAYPHATGTFPVVEAITQTPLVRPDGTVFATPGFDPATRMIYVPPRGFVLPPIPDSPTPGEIEAAKALLLDVLVDFPFEGSADRTNFLGFCITPLIRPQVDVVPMAAIDSPVAGSGKGLLTDVACIMATGEVAAVIPPPASREEWPKLLASLLDNGRTFVVFDNLHDALKSDALEAVLTKPFLQFRQLGHTRERIVPNRATWAVTGNNVAVSRDMVRRCYRIRIDPRCAQPHLRKKFKYNDLVGHCKSQRPSLMAALLVLIRAWYAAGKPAFGGTALGTYTSWKEKVGGILKNAGFEDFLGNQRTLYADMDVESEEWEGFLAQIHEQFALVEFSVADVVNMIHGGSISALPREVARIYGQSTSHKETRPNAYFGVQLGHILRAHRGTRYGDREIHLERGTEDRHRKVVRWRICQGK